jgi:endogenous inhibitor of DNA gyrase (YacG/DUF329 family)
MTKLPPCPTCKKPSVFDFRPFCSKRCADIDLARWFKGDYRIEGDAEPENKEELFEDE